MCYDLIKKYESCRLIAYPDPATGGVPWTIGYGSTINANGQPFKQGDEITKETAEALLRDYLIKDVCPVFNKIPYRLTEKQRQAVASLCYNIGTPAFLKSSLFKAICEKDIKGIFSNWNWISANGKVMKGLAKRRAEELFLFMEGL